MPQTPSPSEYQQAIGECALHWNEAESLIDHFVCLCLQIPDFIQADFVTEFGSIDGKVKLIRLRLEHDLGKEDADCTLMLALLGHAKGLKKRRDRLVHMIPDYELELGTSKQRQASVKVAPMNLDEIRTVARHMDALVEELMLASNIFSILYGPNGAPIWFDDHNTLERAQRVQEAMKDLKGRLQMRCNLAPLPALHK
ncbi:MAG: hypothetical protein WDM79_06660 [Terricaulis sp.]